MILAAGTTYTFKVDSGSLWQFGEGDIMDRVSFMMEGTGTIHSVKRPGGMSYYMVTLDVTKRTDAENVRTILRTGFAQAGFENAEVIEIQEGAKTTNVLKELVAGAFDAGKPATDYVFKLVVALMVIVVLTASLYLFAGRART